jgi:hypothetical protein
MWSILVVLAAAKGKIFACHLHLGRFLARFGGSSPPH